MIGNFFVGSSWNWYYSRPLAYYHRKFFLFLSILSWHLYWHWKHLWNPCLGPFIVGRNFVGNNSPFFGPLIIGLHSCHPIKELCSNQVSALTFAKSWRGPFAVGGNCVGKNSAFSRPYNTGLGACSQVRIFCNQRWKCKCSHQHSWRLAIVQLDDGNNTAFYWPHFGRLHACCAVYSTLAIGEWTKLSVPV